MSWIKIIDDKEATGLLKKIYQKIEAERGKIPNIMKIHSLNPLAMKAHLDLYLSLMFSQSGLMREECEMLATVVSAANSCEYCVNHHGEALNHYWKDKEKLQKLISDFKSLHLPEKTLKMLEYAVKLTRTPEKINREDVDVLRESGFSDEDILNINLIISYFNFVNRIALGLGVEFTPDEVRGYKV